MTSALPKQSTLHLSLRQRAVGRVLDVETTPQPSSPSESDLAADIFWLAYAHEAHVKDPMPDERIINQALLNHMQAAPKWSQSLHTTRGNILASLTMAGTMYGYLITDEALRDALKKQEDANQMRKQVEQMQQQLEQEQNALEEMQQQSGGQGGESGEDEQEEDSSADGDRSGDESAENNQGNSDQSPDGENEHGAGGGSGQQNGEPQSQEPQVSAEVQQQQQRVADLEQQLKDMADKVQQSLQQAKDSIDQQREDDVARVMLNHATKEALDETKGQVAAARGWGLGMSDTVQTDPTAVMQYKELLTDKVKEIAQMAGRLRGIANTARRTKPETGFVPTTVAFTQHIGDMLPEELMMLAPGAPSALRYDTMSRYVEPGLLGLERKGDGQDAGPFVGAVDESGSMGGLREVVAKAIALVCADIARNEGREYALIAFSSTPSQQRVVTSSDNWQAHIEWAAQSQWGGTDFDMVIAKAMEEIEALEQNDCADCLFISDGGARVRKETVDAWDAFSAENGARMLYVPVGRDGWSYQEIEDMADEVVPVGDLEQDNADALAAKLGVWVR